MQFVNFDENGGEVENNRIFVEGISVRIFAQD